MTAVKVKAGKASRKNDPFWEMRTGGPYSAAEGDAREIFKCTSCGAETAPDKGWNGAPDKHRCSAGCACRTSDWKPGGGYSAQGRKNFDRIFPNAPGAGL